MDWSTVQTWRALAGKSVASVEGVKTPYGTTSDFDVAIRCTDGTRILIPVVIAANTQPSALGRPVLPDSEAMKDAPGFFTVEEIAAQVAYEETQKRQREADSRRRKEQEIERLQRDLEATG